VPLNLETCLGPVIEDDDAAEDVEPEALPNVLSVGYRRAPTGLLEIMSTIISASLEMFERPSSILFASSAPTMDRNRRIAEQNPGSSDCSTGRSSTSASSCDQTTINRSDSSDVFSGKRRIRTQTMGDEEPVIEESPYLGVSRELRLYGDGDAMVGRKLWLLGR
jgi:hypothetical protein